MYRLVVFSDGGIVHYDRQPEAVPTEALNDLVLQECVENRRLGQKGQQSLLGKTREFTARLAQNRESRTNTAFLYPAALQIADPQGLVNDVAKIWASVGETDVRKFEALIDVRVSEIMNTKSSSVLQNTSGTDPNSTKINAQSNDKESTRPVSTSREYTPSKTKKQAAKKKSKGKKKRTWDGNESGSDSDAVLDYSESKDGSQEYVMPATATPLDVKQLGSQSKSGFVVRELTNELSEILNTEDDEPREQFGFLKRIVGGKKLTDADVQSALLAMEDHLVTKNVAKEVARCICDQVRSDLVGTSTQSWTSVKATVRESVKRTLSRILTPESSTDLLAGIKTTTANKHVPYVVSVVGVNGVGKSTNLGKLGFWFLQNDFKVLIAACDTFRSGAVEQLKVHVQRLSQLAGSHGHVELFDQGYGKDAAVIAKKAVEYGTKNQFDVVLIDTAGRRHNDSRLMSSLEKFGNLAKPDKIIMVGEALVGTDSVEQARNFDSAFGKSRGLDFFLISKVDTVGEMLGTLVNVTYATGVPVLFVGVGQQYTDLRTLSIDWAVDKLLS